MTMQLPFQRLSAGLVCDEVAVSDEEHTPSRDMIRPKRHEGARAARCDQRKLQSPVNNLPIRETGDDLREDVTRQQVEGISAQK